jgi:hypothetical protein
MFHEMNEEEISVSAELIIADLSILTGIKVPTGNSFATLTEYTIASLKEDYPFYTVPLFKLAFKKHASVLTIGEEKSFGRTLSLNDIHQVMNAYSNEILDANREVDEILSKQVEEKILTEDEKQNVIRQSIQQQYESGIYDCTFATFNQLLRDGMLSADSLNKQGFKALQTIKEKYLKIIQSIPIKDEGESIKFQIERKDVQAKYVLICEIEDETKAEVAGLYLQWCKDNKVEKIYYPE